jgi:hypothetical protein
MEWMVPGGLHVVRACLERTAAHTLRYPILCGLLGGLAALREKGELVLVRLRLTAKR